MRDAARVLYAGLDLLDRQLVDRSGRRCGKVDDLELERRDGTLLVATVLTGPGALLSRTGHTRLGGWLRRVARLTAEDERSDIPLARVADIGNHVTLSVEQDELVSYAADRWVRDHVVDHIPGSRRAAE